MPILFEGEVNVADSLLGAVLSIIRQLTQPAKRFIAAEPLAHRKFGALRCR